MKVLPYFIIMCVLVVVVYNKKLDVVESLIADYYFKHPVKVVGSSGFEARIKKCLNLLAFRAKDEYKFVVDNIGEVHQASKSKIDTSIHPVRLYSTEVSLVSSYGWCAAILVHEASQAFIVIERKKRGVLRSRSSRLVFEDQKKIYARMLETLIKVRADKVDIEFMTTLDSKYIDTNNDGRYTREDSTSNGSKIQTWEELESSFKKDRKGLFSPRYDPK